MQQSTNPNSAAPQESNIRLRVRLLFLVPWPLLYLGYWSLENVKGPASEGFGMGGYASGIISAAYAVSLYALNRALVHSKRIPNASGGDRVVYVAVKILFIAGTLGLVPMIFFMYLGLPYSLPGILLTLLSLFKWGSRNDQSPIGPAKV